MPVDESDYRVAAALCGMNVKRMAFDVGERGHRELAQMIGCVDKGQLIAKVVTLGLDGAQCSKGEYLCVIMCALRGMHEDGVPASALRELLYELRSEQVTRQFLKALRVQPGDKP